jgi:hypothetical protein
MSALTAEIDSYLYLYGSDITGVKLARTPNSPWSIADMNQYAYHNSESAEWQGSPLALNDAPRNILSWMSLSLGGAHIRPNLGDVWYDAHHETTVMMWGDQRIDGTFWFSYAEANYMEGPWSTPVGE